MTKQMELYLEMIDGKVVKVEAMEGVTRVELLDFGDEAISVKEAIEMVSAEIETWGVD